MGRPGRKALTKLLDVARAEFNPDFVIANGENVAGGFGITEKIYNQLVESFSIDAITMGNHWQDKKDIHAIREKENVIVLPANEGNINSVNDGFKIFTSKSGVRVAVINLIGQVFMNPNNRSPFEAADKILDKIPESVKIRIVDFHGEATSEKQAIAQYLQDKISMLYGTHSHVQTADERLFAGRCGYITDLGMTGPYDSVIGIRTDAALNRFLKGERKKFEPASQNLWLTGVCADIDESTGDCKSVTRFRYEFDKIREQGE